MRHRARVIGGAWMAVLALFVLGGGSVAAQSLSPSPSPSPSPAASPTPSFALTDRGSASDDRFLLTIETDATQVTTGDTIGITTMWAHKGTEPIDIATSMAGPITFVVEQLDGPFDPGGASDHACRLTTVEARTVEPVPFQKSGGYDASDPMAPQYAAWFADPDPRLPAGVFRITAHAEYGVGECGTDAKLDASVVIAVTAVPSASPSPSDPPIAVWTPIDLDLLPWNYRCFQRFDPSALNLPGGIATDDADLAAMVAIHGADAHLLMVDDRFALIGEPAREPPGARDPLYAYQLERWDGVGAWVWSAEGECRPIAVLTDPPAVGGHWRLDPAFPAPTAGSRVIHALVVARGCPSAVRLSGVPQVVVTDDAVGVVVPVRHRPLVDRSDSDACSPGAATPVTIRLPEPLGDRALYDAGVLPMRRVRVK